MADAPAHTSARPLARSLDPLADESLGGYLLRLAYRLHLTPIHLAYLTGCVTPPTARIGRRLLLDLDIDNFARTTRLTQDETAALTLITWADRYPPIARSRPGTEQRASRDDWLFNHSLRHCPHCLAGDGSPIQQQYGGPWKTIWHLPISFACTDHHVFLQQGCPRNHPPERNISRLITQTANSALHPAQCRAPDSDQPAGRGRKRHSCGVRLDQPQDTGALRPTTSMLRTQQRLLDLLGPNHLAEEAFSYFTDLRLVTALLCASWPLGRGLINPSAAEMVAEYIHELGAGAHQALDKPPKEPVATAAILTAGTTLLGAADLPNILAQHLQANWAGRPSKAPWAKVFARHESSCSEDFRQAARPVTRAYRRTGPRGTKAPARTDGYRPEHIPAFLEQSCVAFQAQGTTVCHELGTSSGQRSRAVC